MCPLMNREVLKKVKALNANTCNRVEISNGDYPMNNTTRIALKWELTMTSVFMEDFNGRQEHSNMITVGTILDGL